MIVLIRGGVFYFGIAIILVSFSSLGRPSLFCGALIGTLICY